MGVYERKDYYDFYGPVMQFGLNKKEYIHGWYPFVEGYSKQFIRSIINELDYTPTHCLEPFAGSGTTPLELQKLNIKCTSFEVNPFMHSLSSAKMRTDYTVNNFHNNVEQFKEIYSNCPQNISEYMSPPNAKTIVENDNLKKWNFNKNVMNTLLKIKYSINKLPNKKYRDLFLITYASILLQVSNLFRNGKCLSYKKDWQNITRTDNEIYTIFLNKLSEVFEPDIIKLNNYKKEGKLMSNYNNCYLGDSRKLISKLDKNSIDLIITSPPYLNSRDYTDSYMVELRMLDYLDKFPSMQDYRSRAIRSHVQVKWSETELLDISLLKQAVSQLEKHKEEFWNDGLLNMVKGYFVDMDIMFKGFKHSLSNNGRIYFNVANSSYYGVEIKVDEIISDIATKNGMQVKEIREARKVSPSSQQKDQISHLVESVIVIHNK